MKEYGYARYFFIWFPSFEIDSIEFYWKKYVTIYLYLSRFMTFYAKVTLMMHVCKCRYFPHVSLSAYIHKRVACHRRLLVYPTNHVKCKCLILDLAGFFSWLWIIQSFHAKSIPNKSQKVLRRQRGSTAKCGSESWRTQLNSFFCLALTPNAPHLDNKFYFC